MKEFLNKMGKVGRVGVACSLIAVSSLALMAGNAVAGNSLRNEEKDIVKMANEVRPNGREFSKVEKGRDTYFIKGNKSLQYAVFTESDSGFKYCKSTNMGRTVVELSQEQFESKFQIKSVRQQVRANTRSNGGQAQQVQSKADMNTEIGEINKIMGATQRAYGGTIPQGLHEFSMKGGNVKTTYLVKVAGAGKGVEFAKYQNGERVIQTMDMNAPSRESGISSYASQQRLQVFKSDLQKPQMQNKPQARVMQGRPISQNTGRRGGITQRDINTAVNVGADVLNGNNRSAVQRGINGILNNVLGR